MKADTPYATKTIRELRVIARQAHVVGWHDLCKHDLISALEKAFNSDKEALKSKSRLKTSKSAKSAGSNKSSKTDKSRSVSKESKKERSRPQPLGKKAPSRKKIAPAPVKKVKETKRKTTQTQKSAVNATSTPIKKQARTTARSVPETTTRKKAVVKSQATTREPASSIKTRKTAKTPVKKVAPSPVKSSKPVATQKSTSKGSTSEPVRKKGSGVKQAASKVVESKPQAASTPEKKKSVKSEKTTKTAPTPQKKGVVPPEPKVQVSTPPEPISETQKKISVLKEKLLLHKTLGSDTSGANREPRNQLILMVRDPFWLHAYWEISPQLVDRIRAAMGHLWHTADPVLRLFKMHSDSVGTLRKEYLSDIRIHGGINNWYIDVEDPPSSFLVEIGYLARDGQFFILLSSNIVETPQRYVHDSFGHPDVSWTGIPTDFQQGRYVENGTTEFRNNKGNKSETVSRTFAASPVRAGSSPATWTDAHKTFGIEVDAELVIKGQVTPHVQVTIKGENIRLKEDGTFSIRYHLPERRHVFPVAAVSPDGVETKTIILAVERNTKILETVVRDEDDD